MAGVVIEGASFEAAAVEVDSSFRITIEDIRDKYPVKKYSSSLGSINEGIPRKHTVVVAADSIRVRALLAVKSDEVVKTPVVWL